MVSFLVFFGVSSQTVAVYSSKSGYPSAETPYLDFELQFLLATATGFGSYKSRDTVPKVVLYSVL